MAIMGIMNLKSRQEFQKLHSAGLRALNGGKYSVGLKCFEEADVLASHNNNDRRRRLDALNPLAHSLWALGEYKKAEQKLALAAKIASDLGLRDELAIVFSNFGRLESVKVIKKTPVSKQAQALRRKALPYFMKSYRMLDGHSHLYFRYSNAKYGAVVAVLAQDYKKSANLVAEGLGVAFKKGSKFDMEVTYKTSPSGLEYFAVSAGLIKLGAQNPLSREYKHHEKAARELVK
jgi:tetratricopeptide (TPR) repeat protein